MTIQKFLQDGRIPPLTKARGFLLLIITEDNGSTVTLYAQWGESTELPNTGGHGTRELEAGAVTGMGICLAAAIISRKHQNAVIRN